MTAEELLCRSTATLAASAEELRALAGTRADFGFRRAELENSFAALRVIESLLESIDKKTALEWQAATGKRLVWRLWPRLKSS